MKNKKFMFAGILLIMILLVACAGLILLQHRKIASSTKAVSEINDIDEQIKSLNDQLDEYESEYSSSIAGKGTVSFVICQLDKDVVGDAYSILNQRDFTAVLGLSEDNYPGEDGCISMKAYQELKKADWGICLYWDGQEDLGDFLKNMKSKMKKDDINFPSTLYVKSGSYDENVDETAEKYDITNIIHHGETGMELLASSPGDDEIWHIGACGYYNSYFSSYVSSALNQGKSIVFSVGKAAEDEYFSTNAFGSAVSTVQQYASSDQLEVGTIRDVKKYKESLREQQTDAQKDYESKKAEIEEQIQELEAKRNAANQ